MKKIGIVIPDGTGIRNYLFSNLISELQKNDCKIILYHSISQKAIEEINNTHHTQFETCELPTFIESPTQKFYRETICYARLLYNAKLTSNPTILKHWNPRKKSFKNKLFYWLVEMVAKRMHTNYNKILKYETKFDNSILKNIYSFEKILEDTNPDILFSTHQRSMNAVQLVKAAKKKGINTIGAIFSWDNLPKARLTVRTDSYVVWSEYMKSELNTYYPEIKNDVIEITGTPQFEFYYNQKNIIEKEAFYMRYDLDVSKKIICFSGDDKLTSPFDPKYLQDTVEVIADQKLDIQIILRRAPVDISGRFNYLIEKYPEIIKSISPMWISETDDLSKWQTIYPSYKDIQLLVSTVYYATAVINLGSTMALDFAMFNKPAAYLNYDTEISSHWSVEMIYNYQHFRTMKGLDPVLWINSKNDISKVLFTLMDSPRLDNKKWLDLIANKKQKASENIAKKIISCI